MKKEVKDFISNSYQMLRDKEEFDMVISQVGTMSRKSTS